MLTVSLEKYFFPHVEKKTVSSHPSSLSALMLTLLPAARPTTPSPTTGLVLKSFELQNLVAAYSEATAYCALKNLQGLIIPYCYGVYDIDGTDGVGLFLEMSLACWEGLLRLHNAGYAHRDVCASNIMISSEDIVFVDLENSA
jgi:hypothetical protein